MSGLADEHIRRMDERERRQALLRRVQAVQSDILARRGGEPLSSALLDDILEDESDRICCAAHADLYLPEGAPIPAAIIEAEAHVMTTYASSSVPPAHTDEGKAEDFTQTAEYRRRLALIRRIDQIQADILAERGGEPIPAEVLDEILDEVKRGE